MARGGWRSARHLGCRRHAGKTDPEAALLVTTRWEGLAGGFRREPPGTSHQQLGVERAERRHAAPALEEDGRVDERPPPRVRRSQPPLADALLRHSVEFRL